MHTPCPTPSLITKTNRGLRNTLHNNPGYAFCSLRLRTVYTLYWASLIHRFDEFHRCANAIVTIGSLSFFVSRSPSSFVHDSLLLCLLLLLLPFLSPVCYRSPFPVNRSQPYVSYIYVLLIFSYFYLDSLHRRGRGCWGIVAVELGLGVILDWDFLIYWQFWLIIN